jgi:hypothetical protein
MPHPDKPTDAHPDKPTVPHPDKEERICPELRS